MPAIVVFHGHGTWPWRLWLKAGFRHCFIAVSDGAYWIVIDGTNGSPQCRVLAAAGIDLASHYRGAGYVVRSALTNAVPPCQPVMLGTCVGMVKRLLGIRAPFILTPWQLYRRLAPDGR